MRKIEYFILDYNPEHNERGCIMLDRTIEALYSNMDRSLCSKVYMINQGGNKNHHVWHESRREFWKYSLISLDDNVGISRAINFSAQLCKSPVMCLVTSDSLFTDGLDVSALKVLEDPAVAMVLPLSDISDLEYQRAEVDEFHGDGVVYLPQQSNLQTIVCELTIKFYNMRIFQEIGFYDERWKAGHENMDFCLRAFLSGRKTIIDRNAFAWHYGHGCYQTGAVKTAYKGYIDTAENGGGSAETIQLWRNKWPGLDIYSIDPEKDNRHLLDAYRRNIYLPFVQNVPY